MNTPAELAGRLIEAAGKRAAIQPLTSTDGPFSSETAYLVQDQVVAARIACGAPVVGAKLGLTSAAKRRQMNVEEPLYGWLTGDMAVELGQPLCCEEFIQPRCEPEIAFVLRHDIAGAHVTAAQVLAATDAVYPALDVLDSRFAGYSFTLSDVIADNASGAGFAVGGQATSVSGIDLRTTGVVLEKNGELAAAATGAAVLGHPAASVAWLVRALAARDRGLTRGQIVLSGGLTEAVPVAPGDVVVARFDRLGAIELVCQ